MHPAITAILAGLGVSQIATYATTVYLHRCATHGALKLHPAAAWAFKAALWITTGQETHEWVAVHRKHHAHSDEAEDPHSPLQLGFWKVQILNWWYYAKETKNLETIEKYASDIQLDWWDRNVFRHGLLGMGLGILGLYVIFGFWAILAMAVHALTYVGVLTACINALGHTKVRTGYQNYVTDWAKKTYNYKWLAWLTGGEGLHNNHHGDPGSALLAHKPGETDPGGILVVALEISGLATEVRRPSLKHITGSST